MTSARSRGKPWPPLGVQQRPADEGQVLGGGGIRASDAVPEVGRGNPANKII